MSVGAVIGVSQCETVCVRHGLRLSAAWARLGFVYMLDSVRFKKQKVAIIATF